MRRGEIWWADIKPKRRPVLVLTRDAAIPLLRKVVIVPATTTVRGIPSEVALDERDGMPGACALAFDNLRSVPKHTLRSRITTLPESRLDELCSALRFAAGCL